MSFNKISHLGIGIFLSAILLAACAPMQASTPTSSSNQVPITGLTASVTDTPADVASTAPSNANPTATSTANPTAGSTSAATTGSTGSGIKYVLDASSSSASYAVREQLARLNLPSDAVGKTNAISGEVVINPDGSIDTANSKFTVDVSTLQTDSSMRDNYVAHNILQSDQYPQAMFVPTQTSGLPAVIPQSGNLSFKLTGNLTIRNVTKPVTWDVTGSITNGAASGTATTSFTFEDFSLNQPSVPIVLSVVDKITLTITIGLKPAGS